MPKRILLLDILGSHLLFLCFFMIYAGAASSRVSKPNCRDQCGNITIPFPFGMDRSECFLDEWYEIDCQNEAVPFLKKLKLQVLVISLTGYSNRDETYITVNYPIIYSNPGCYPKVSSQPPSLEGSPFFFAPTLNIFVAVGCNVSAQLSSYYTFVGCKLECRGGNFSRYSTCSGFDNCCKITVPSGLQMFGVDFNSPKDATGINDQACNFAVLASESWLDPSYTDLDSLKMKGSVPVVLIWGIPWDSDVGQELFSEEPNDKHDCSYFTTNDTEELMICSCHSGYEGNPYLRDGCQDINECEDPSNHCPRRCVNTPGSYDCVDPSKTLKLIMIGIGCSLGALLLVLVGWWLYKIIKKKKEKQVKEKYFKRNGGLILQHQILSSKGNVQNGKLFSQKEIQMATENFSESRVIGKGGQGTVYKGMLMDGRIVAVKKASAIDEGKVEQFINEVMILSQVSHRNIVKLLGCCLEIEIPLLVYEFLPNGNLYDYLHGSNKDYLLPWEARLRLATEIAGALFYLHSTASMPIYHRDIKSTNILLDEKYKAKIADFGISRSISIDQTHLTTLVQGTIGYLDPEYFQTNQFTDKSDVYSFGVVLVELLTRQKPISTMRMEEGINLAAYFNLSMGNGCLFDILDGEILNQGTGEEILKVAHLAKRCLHSNGRNRPTMKEVIIELEGIKKPQHLSNVQESEESRMQVQPQDIFRPVSARLKFNTHVIASSDVQPLLLGKTW